MSEQVNTLGPVTGNIGSQAREYSSKWDFGPVVLYQGASLTFVSFGLLVGVGAFLGFLQTWFYLGMYHVLPQAAHANQLALSLGLGAPLSAYIITRLLDIKTWLRGEKTLLQYLRTVSFGLWGGLTGGILILSTFAWLTGTPLLALLDAFAVGIPLAQIFGRIGCLNYGCCHGTECSSQHQPGIRYYNAQTKVLRYAPRLRGRRLHPTQIYSALANGLIYLLLLGLWLLWDTRPAGALAGIYMGLYGLKRFSVEFLRGEFPRVYILGLTLWQWFSLLFVALGGLLMLVTFLFGNQLGTVDPAYGWESMSSSLGLLGLTAVVMGLAYGTHGRKIGSW